MLVFYRISFPLCKIKAIIGTIEERTKDEVSTLASNTGTNLPDLSIYYQVQSPEEHLEDVAMSVDFEIIIA